MTLKQLRSLMKQLSEKLTANNGQPYDGKAHVEE